MHHKHRSHSGGHHGSHQRDERPSASDRQSGGERGPWGRDREDARFAHDDFSRRGPSRGRGPFDHHHQGDRHRRGRRDGRFFEHGELRLVVLALIAERPRHGYEIMRAIEERLAGTYSPSPGVIYPTLTMLEEIGHATVGESDGKKLYTITDDGRAYLATNTAAVAAVMMRMNDVHATHGGGRAPEITRAVSNLSTALRLREERGPLSEEQLRAIAAALDAAAMAVERS